MRHLVTISSLSMSLKSIAKHFSLTELQSLTNFLEFMQNLLHCIFSIDFE